MTETRKQFIIVFNVFFLVSYVSVASRANGQEGTEDPTKLSAAEVMRYSPVGAGRSGEVVVSPGEDWWLPDGVEWSDHGSIVCGYGEPWGKEKNWVCRGQASWLVWKGLEQEPGKLGTQALNSLLTRYGESVPPEGKKAKQLHLYVHGTDCGCWSPEYLSRPPYNVPPLPSLIDQYRESIPANILKLWNDRWTSHLEWAYPFWHPVYIERRLAFHKLLADYLSNHPFGARVHVIDLMGEFATLWMYELYGLASLETIDEAAEPYVRSALDSGIPAEKWLIPLGVGGRAYHRFAELAAKYRTGIGNHGARGIMPYQFAQHLTHLEYDENLKAYRWTTDRLPYAFFHTDCEYLDKTPNAVGQYRSFRFCCLAAISMGVNQILVSASTIPSLGHKGGRPKAPPFLWNEVNAQGGLQFVEWMNRTLGRPVDEAPEAYCSLAQTGTPIPEGVSFSNLIRELKQERKWKPFPNYARTPLLKYFGRFCDLDTTVPGGSGTPVLEMSEKRLGTVEPSFDTWASGDGAFEARATCREDGNPCLFFRLDDRFIGPDRKASDVVVKVTFANPQKGDGSWRLEYDGENGWTKAPEVDFSWERGGKESDLWTATFHLTDAMFANRGPERTDLAIRSVKGVDAAFLLVRIIPRLAGQ